MNPRKLLLIVAIAALVGIFFTFDLSRFFSLDFVKSQQAAIDAWRAAQPVLTAGIFFAVYVAVTGLSLPGAAIMTLAAGAIFGVLWGRSLSLSLPPSARRWPFWCRASCCATGCRANLATS